jgi:hypothetical protein
MGADDKRRYADERAALGQSRDAMQRDQARAFVSQQDEP